ncbi:hypothetical protein G8A07_12725 [Roseateles sp. DAIF2]|uniref:hypothetical protein n=1 Tax=Roseateles sp. DAIF2 TaxID=2714952 RepID=UPI0018A31E2C|nr:hypothetical protein [Roseateles sp. DAIF2]QPF73700.1 hypothetical protein G8A07_12725 [Roseateles sp. DAIF2]
MNSSGLVAEMSWPAPWARRIAAVLTARPWDYLLLFWCLLAFAATPILLLRVSPFAGRVPEAVVGLVGLMVAWALLVIGRGRVAGLRGRLAGLPGLAVALLAGAALRLAWAVVFPSVPASDGSTYLELARALAAGQPYLTDGTWAYWPVGYPLWLSAWIRLVGEGPAVLLSQVSLFVLAICGIHRLARHLRGETAARVAVWAFALWPNLWAQTSVPEKEALVLALLPWLLLLLLDLRHVGRALLAGLALGLCILVQPGLQFLLPGLLLLLCLRLPLRRVWIPALLLLLGSALVVLPWTLRNLQVLGAPVLVSTNGGGNLYRANNPLANGGYTPRGEVDLSGLSELESDRQGKALALAWIRSHPGEFAALALEKQLRFMGDDSASIYASLRIGGGTQDLRVYMAAKLLANLWWLAVWLLLALAVRAGRRDQGAHEERWLIWGWLYLFALHSIFESASKYHLPMIWVPCVLLGCLLSRPQQESQ